MAESRIAQSYIQLFPLLDKGFTKDLQKAINAALRGIDWGLLSEGAREEGRRAGREFRKGFESGAGDNGPELNYRDTISEAGKAGRKAGKDFAKELEDAGDAADVDVNLRDTIAEAAKAGRKAGENFQEGLDKGKGNEDLVDFEKTVAEAKSAGREAGKNFGDALDNASKKQTSSFKQRLNDAFADVVKQSDHAVISPWNPKTIADGLKNAFDDIGKDYAHTQKSMFDPRVLGDKASAAGKQAGRQLKEGIEAGIDAIAWTSLGTGLNSIKYSVQDFSRLFGNEFRAIITDAGEAGRRAGQSFRQRLDNSVGSEGALFNWRKTILDAAASGKQAGRAFSDAVQANIANLQANFPSIGPTPASSQAAGAQAGMTFTQGLGAAIGAAMAGIGAQVTGALSLAGIGALSKMGLEQAAAFDAGNKEISASLNITDEDQKEKVKTAVKNLFNKGYAWEDAEIAVEATLAADTSILERTQEELDNTSRKLMFLNQAFEIDMPRALQVAGQMWQQGFVGSVDEGLDYLGVAMQDLPLSIRDEILENMNEYSKHFEGMGFSKQAAFTMVINAGKVGGEMGIDQTSDSLKEVGIILGNSFGNQTVTDDLAKIGLDSKDISSAIIEGGPAADAALEAVALGLLGVQDESERTALAISLIGTPLEELGVSQIDELLNDIAKANDAFADTKSRMEEMAAELDGSFSQSLAKLKNEAISTFAEAFEPTLEALLPLVQGLTDFLIDNRETIKTFLVPVLAIGAALSALVAVGVVAWLAPIIGGFIAANAAVLIVSAVIIGLIALFVWIFSDFEGFSAGIKGMWEDFTGFMDGISESLYNSAFGEWVRDMVDGFQSGLDSMVEGWNDFVDFISEGVDGVGNWFEETFSGSAEGGGTSNSTIGGIKLPGMATGGDVLYRPGGTPMIVGEKDPETIVNRGKINNVLDKVQDKLINSGGTPMHVELHAHAAPGMDIDTLADTLMEKWAFENRRR